MITLLRETNFWVIPFVPFRRRAILRLRDGREFLVKDLMDVWITKEVVLDRQYGLYGKPARDWTVIDIGAGIGDFAIVVGEDAGRVLAFEADAQRLEMARINSARNQIDSVTLIHERVTDLDHLFRHWNVTRCNLLKIDCEGCEYQLLMGASDGILHATDRIVTEMHLAGCLKAFRDPLLQRLRETGFTVTSYPNRAHKTLELVLAARDTAEPNP